MQLTIITSTNINGIEVKRQLKIIRAIVSYSKKLKTYDTPTKIRGSRNTKVTRDEKRK